MKIVIEVNEEALGLAESNPEATENLKDSIIAAVEAVLEARADEELLKDFPTEVRIEL